MSLNIKEGKWLKKKKRRKKKDDHPLKKEDLQSEKRRLINRDFKSQIRTAIRTLEDALPKKDATLNKKHLSEIYSLMDKGVEKRHF